jgi:hypothetical protein
MISGELSRGSLWYCLTNCNLMAFIWLQMNLVRWFIKQAPKSNSIRSTLSGSTRGAIHGSQLILNPHGFVQLQANSGSSCVAIAPARATPRSTRRKMGSHQSACWFRYWATSVLGSTFRSGTKKTREGSKMVTGTQPQTSWAQWSRDFAERLETHLTEVNHKGELRYQHSEPLAHARLLHTTIY